MNQWLLEAKAHAPTLKCRIYEGSETDRLLFADDINQYDVIFTSYDLLRKDVNISVADKMQDRPRRREARYTRAYSPLVRFKWWRVIMDEAQMIAKEGTKPEEMASRIPREISWAVTGTPTDVPGLLRFVDKEFSYHMYSESSYHMYSTGSGYIGSALLPFFLHRNRKDNVSKEVTIPPQTDRVLYLNFTTIERTWYDQLYETLRERQERHEAQAKDLEPEEERKHHEERARLLNEWLQQLRQTCCHPQTGSQNRRTLGTRIRTLGEVLNVMMKQASTTAAATERQYHLERIYEAHLLEFRASDADWKEGADEPLQIYKSVFKDVHATVDDIKKEIKYLEEESKKAAREDTDKSDHDSDEEGEDEDEEVQEFESLTGKLQSWQELEHRVVYFMASLYHSIRNEQLETEYYEVASRLRRQILAVAESEVNKVINRFKLTSIEPSLKKNGPMVLGKLRLNGGLRAWQMTENFQSVCDLLDGQWRTIADWRKYMTDTLLEPVEESDAPAGEVIGLDDGKETNEGGKGSEKPVPTGEEYKEGVERQSRAAIYLDWYVAALEDRRQLLTGHRATTEQSHVRNREDHVGTGGIPFTCVETELREKLRSEIDPFCLPAEEQPIRTTLMDLRRLSKDKELPEAEAATVTLTAAKVTDILQSQVSKLDLLEREVQLFRKLFNVRIAYYKQLQRISDGVVAVDRPDRLEDALKQCRETAQSLQKQVVTLNARRRYLQTINEEERERSQDQTAAAQPNETPAATIERECLICRNFFMRGILTPCGHLYCNECVVIWIDRYQKCPACNQKVKRGESTPVTLEVPVEKFVAPLRLDPVSFSSNRIEDVPIKDETSLIRQLSNIPLRGGSLGSKLDTILRHLQFIRQNDPTAKTLIFSQWENLLTILAVGMTRNKIPHVKLVNGSRAHRSDALRQFNDDPSMQVIMLNARSQSAGLTLVAANHVMLLEPVVNIGLELQAISRVHRIGQKRETTIWRYIVKSTVEERIFHLARDRRRDLRLKGKLEQASDPNAKLAKPSHGGGELVEAEDSAWCLLGDEGWDAFKAASEARVAAESRPADSEEIPPPPEYVIRQRREARQSEIIWAAMLDDGGDNTREMAPVVEEADVDEDSDSSEAAADSTEEADTSANQPATSPSTKRKRDFDSEASSAIEAPTTGVFPNPHEDSSAKSENGDKENETFGETQPELIDQNPLEGDLALHPIRSSMGSGRMGKKARGGGSRLAVGEIRLDM
ncbi:hypothetical protein DFS34DRAFT_114978 [Phlyctochytrium arcticum]|nr:hypothetical protein DFS34DRAFT_114978 [Phlyctochytrium arcticum]